MWTLDEALGQGKLLEAIASVNSFHVALTGGLLYKDGPRKDADFVMYQVRPSEKSPDENKQVILGKLEEAGFTLTDYGFVTKVAFKDPESQSHPVAKKQFDILWPHEPEDNYLG